MTYVKLFEISRKTVVCRDVSWWLGKKKKKEKLSHRSQFESQERLWKLVQVNSLEIIDSKGDRKSLIKDLFI